MHSPNVSQALTDILTPRLRLVPMTPALVAADRSSPDALSSAIGATVPATWSPEHWEPHVFDFLHRQFAAHPHTIGWNRYIVVRDRSTLIGTLGGFPKPENEAEIGYSILEPWHRQGFGTEATQALVHYLFAEARLDGLQAQTFPHLTPSVRILEKLGFTPAGRGEDPGAIRFHLARPSST